VSRIATYYLVLESLHINAHCAVRSSQVCNCIALYAHISFVEHPSNECMEVFKHAGTAYKANIMLACYNTYRLTNVLYCTLVKRASV
jgi:hypothetical protein